MSSLYSRFGFLTHRFACSIHIALNNANRSTSNLITESVSNKLWIPQMTFVRHRYYADKIANGPLIRNYGFKENMLNKGLLPHMKADHRISMPLYKPKNSWSEKRALFGQNDYIDILGPDGLTIKPFDVCYTVPHWLRGFQGNELHMLMRRYKIKGKIMALKRPTKYMQMKQRIYRLRRFLNEKTKDFYWKKGKSVK